MIRAFVAVELSDAVRAEVASLENDLRAPGTDVKWVDPATLHLTLKFLGDIDETQKGALEKALREAARGMSPFEIGLEGIGAFPGTTRPRVIWVGVGAGKERLVELSQKVEAACLALGFPAEERPFNPHLTIARLREPQNSRLLVDRHLASKFEPVEFEAAELVVYESDLLPTGSVYRVISRHHLGVARK